MLEINEDTVRFIIDKAREFHAKEMVSIPEQPLSPSDDWALQVLADHLDDPCYSEVVSVVRDLDPDQRAALVALMWCGRGDFEAADEWETAFTEAAAAANARTAQYLLSTPLVADYLEEGLLQVKEKEQP